jgi:hypothetical protein
MRSTLTIISVAAIFTILYILLFEIAILNSANTTHTQVVVVEKISLSEYKSFNVSGKYFSIHVKEITFGVNDTIVIKGDLVYPKNNPKLTVKKTWH